MARRLIIDDATGVLYDDFTARRQISLNQIFSAEGGASETIEVFLVTVNPQTRAVTTHAIATANISLDAGLPLAKPEGGKVSFTYGADTTREIPVKTLTADTLAAALNGLDAVEQDGGIHVWPAGDPGQLGFYLRLQDTGAPGTNPTVDCDGCTPPSAAEVTVVKAGSGTERALWLVQIAEKPVAAIAESAWSTATSGSFGGLTASLSLNSAGLLAHLAKENPPPLTLTIKESGSVLYRGQFEAFAPVDATDLNGTALISIFPQLVTSTSNPTVNDDSGDGYGVGTIWINTSSPGAFILISNGAGAANWDLLSEGSNLTASRAVVTDSSGVVTASAVTSTELGYLDGVTSAIQTQLDAKLALAGGTLTGTLTLGSGGIDASYNTISNLSDGSSAQDAVTKTQLDAVNTTASAALPKAGGTMSGAIAMGSSKVTGLAEGTANGDAIRFEQLRTIKNDQTGTAYTLVIGDATKTVRLNNASTVTVTVPKSVFVAGDTITLFRKGAGGVTVSPVDSDVTINSVGTKRKLAYQYSAATLICVTGGATPEFDLIGDLTT